MKCNLGYIVAFESTRNKTGQHWRGTTRFSSKLKGNGNSAHYGLPEKKMNFISKVNKVRERIAMEQAGKGAVKVADLLRELEPVAPEEMISVADILKEIESAK